MGLPARDALRDVLLELRDVGRHPRRAHLVPGRVPGRRRRRRLALDGLRAGELPTSRSTSTTGRSAAPTSTPFEAIAADHGGRPHWGKLHTRGADYLRGVYPRFDDFLAVRDRVDPERRFGNPYLERVLG